MPITRSAKKALRASDRKRVFNLARAGKVSKSVKTLKKFVAEGKKKEALAELRNVQKALDKAVKGKTILKNAASRKKSRLSAMVKKIESK
ncbi:MAG: ribosomal protein small subunit ribosomal protein [Parcubacteria group bacterium]|nr:ribosomal protein small subunit ribosomal protein [Parcubacteria group bacterium]